MYVIKMCKIVRRILKIRTTITMNYENIILIIFKMYNY